MKTHQVYLVCEREQLDETVMAVLSTLFFLRFLGKATPGVSTSSLGVNYPQITEMNQFNDILKAKIKAIGEEVSQCAIDSSTAFITSMIMVKFYETLLTKTDSSDDLQMIKGFSNTKDNTARYLGCWETWVITIDVFVNNKTPNEPKPKNTPFIADINSQLGCQTDYTFAFNDRKYLASKLVSEPLSARLKIYQRQYQSEIFEILKIVDSAKDQIPNNITNSYIPPLLLESTVFVNSKLQDELDLLQLKFKNTQHSNIKLNESLGLSQESFQYVTTSDNGDVLVPIQGKLKLESKVTDGSINGSSGEQKPGDEIWKQGYTFIKKMLE